MLSNIVLAAACFVLAPQQPAPSQDKPAPKVAVYDEKADGSAQIAAALARAKKDNQRVLIQWGANWCGWCVLLDELCKKNADVRRKLSYEYQVVKIDIGKWDKHLDLAAKYGADFKKAGVPYLTFLDADGKVLGHSETGVLEAEIDGVQGHDPKKVVELLAQHQAKYLDAGEVRAAALARAKAERKRVFLHFGAPWCGWCHKLENWMAQPEVAALLAKDFVDLKIDTDRMTGGAEAMKAARGNDEGGIPWFEFLDADGASLAVSEDAKGGTIGFPYVDEEIAVFVAMLEKTRVNLTAADVETLRKSLVANREADEAKKKAAAGAK